MTRLSTVLVKSLKPSLTDQKLIFQHVSVLSLVVKVANDFSRGALLLKTMVTSIS